MQIAILLYDRFTSLDAVGPYELLARLPGAETVFVADRTGPVPNDQGSLSLVAERTIAEVQAPDIVLVPGGPGARQAMHDETLLDWLRAADAASTWTTSVCTGSLVLGGAGLLKGRRATSHWLALDDLVPLGAEPTGSVSSSTASTSRPRGSRPGSTWRCTCSAASAATRSPRRFSC